MRCDERRSTGDWRLAAGGGRKWNDERCNSRLTTGSEMGDGTREGRLENSDWRLATGSGDANGMLKDASRDS